MNAKTKKTEQTEETKKAPAAPGVDFTGSSEWETRPTVNDPEPLEEAEWVTPSVGTIIEGQLVRAFVMRDDLAAEQGKKPYRAAFVVVDENGNEWTFGEKASFTKELREHVTIGTFIRLEFTGKKVLTNPKTGRPNGKQLWLTDLKTRGVGTGKLVIDALHESHKELIARGGDVPF